jgi:hypothetical protein
MDIIINIQNNIVVIYEINSFLCNLGGGKLFPNNIHQANSILPIIKNSKKPIIPPYYRWVVSCIVKDIKSIIIYLSLPISYRLSPRTASTRTRIVARRNCSFAINLYAGMVMQTSMRDLLDLWLSCSVCHYGSASLWSQENPRAQKDREN